jgi:cytidine deaminase
MSEIDWPLLKEQAVSAMKSAYVPYSKFPVGVAALVDDGRIISGCNVENASYGLTLCAECGLVSNLVLSGGGRLVAFICVDLNENYLMPCGRCRQLLQEHGGSNLAMMTDQGVKPLAELLPWAFGPEEMEKRLD